MPIVGFFDQRARKTKRLATFTNDPVENCNDEQRPLLPPKQNYSVAFSDDSIENERLSSKRQSRSGKELWSILQHHVVHESFHIQSQFKDTVRCKLDNIQFTDDVDLPYDFSVFQCFLALAVYLIISIIAFSFVFEKWTMIDSKCPQDDMSTCCASYTIDSAQLKVFYPFARLHLRTLQACSELRRRWSKVCDGKFYGQHYLIISLGI